MYANYDEAIDAYDEMLDVTMDIGDAGAYATAAEIVRNCDPIAYRVEFFDWLDSEGVDSDELDEYGSYRLPS